MADLFYSYTPASGNTALVAGESTTVTYVFKEAVTGLTLTDFTVSPGLNLSGLVDVNGDGITWRLAITVDSTASGSLYLVLERESYSAVATGLFGDKIIQSFEVSPAPADTTPPDATTTQISLNAVTADNVIDKTESEQTVNVTGKVTGEFTAGDVVTITANNTAYTGTVAADGSYSVAVAGSALVADADNNITASIAASDAEGNKNTDASIITSIAYGVDTVAKGEFTLANFTDSVNSHVQGSATDNISQDNSFDLTVANLESGASVVYQQLVNGKWQDTTAAQNNLADGAYQFRAVITDTAGNVSEQSINVTVDTTADAAPADVTVQDNQVTGTATAGSIAVLQNAAGAVLATAQVAADGSFNMGLPANADTSDLFVASVDTAGNVSATTEVSLPAMHYKVYTAAYNWNATHGSIDYYSYKTTAGNDWIEIGNGDRNCWTCGTQGNIWNPYPSTGYATIATGAGNDRIDTGVSGGYGNMYADTAVEMGSGDDTFNLKGQMYSNSIVDMGIGDDVINIGGNVHNHAEIYAGEGNDTLTVGEDIDDYAKVSMGAGNDTVTVNEDIEGKAQVALGDGNDSLTVAYDVEGCSSIDTGAGNDTIKIGEDVEDYVHINMGAGNDVLSVARFVENETVIDMGDGDNTATMAGLNNWASISFGSGDDSLTVTHQFGVGGGYASASLGAGNDTFTFGGTTLDGVVNGGSGLDTLVLTYNQSDVATSRCCHETNLTSHNFTGFELIDMQGNNAVDIRYSDLVQDTTRDGALFIKGDANSKVDLGNTDWNSDTDTNLADASGGHWTATGSSVVDGVVYDVYHHCYATDTSNDVYIQQGVMVI